MSNDIITVEPTGVGPTGSIQVIEVSSPILRITAYGARGEDGSTTDRGFGARATGTFEVPSGAKLHVLVGQEPETSSTSGGGNAGGGSFVALEVEETHAHPDLGQLPTGEWVIPLLVAGGGGGGANNTSHPGYDYIHGQDWNWGDVGGIGHTSSSGAGGGGSWSQDGDNVHPGSAFLNGGEGGPGGGFGGAGGQTSTYNDGGGGGGYSGGSHTYDGTTSHPTGGGSYNDGEEQVNETGVNDGPGLVEIESLVPPGGVILSSSPAEVELTAPYRVTLSSRNAWVSLHKFHGYGFIPDIEGTQAPLYGSPSTISFAPRREPRHWDVGGVIFAQGRSFSPGTFGGDAILSFDAFSTGDEHRIAVKREASSLEVVFNLEGLFYPADNPIPEPGPVPGGVPSDLPPAPAPLGFDTSSASLDQLPELEPLKLLLELMHMRKREQYEEFGRWVTALEEYVEGNRLPEDFQRLAFPYKTWATFNSTAVRDALERTEDPEVAEALARFLERWSIQHALDEEDNFTEIEKWASNVSPVHEY